MKKYLILLILFMSPFAYADSDTTIDGEIASGHIIQDEGVKVKQREKLNFVGGGVTVTDTNGKTTVTIPSGAAPTDATYLTSTANGTLSSEVNLGALSTGFLYGTVAGGTSTISSVGTIDISTYTNLTAGDHITLTGDDLDIDDDFLLNTGDIGTGTYNFTGADSFTVPDAVNPTEAVNLQTLQETLGVTLVYYLNGSNVMSTTLTESEAYNTETLNATPVDTLTLFYKSTVLDTPTPFILRAGDLISYHFNAKVSTTTGVKLVTLQMKLFYVDSDGTSNKTEVAPISDISDTLTTTKTFYELHSHVATEITIPTGKRLWVEIYANTSGASVTYPDLWLYYNSGANHVSFGVSGDILGNFVQTSGDTMTGALTINNNDGVDGETMLTVGDSDDLDNIKVYGDLTVSNIFVQSGGIGQLGYDTVDGELRLYSEQAPGTDYIASLFANTAMTSAASFYLPADEPVATSFINMTTGGVMGFVAPNAGTNIANDLEEEVTEGSLADSTIVSADIKDDVIIEPDLSADNSPSDGDILTYDSTGTNFNWITQNAGTNITADLEEEVTEGSLADSTIVSADIKDGTIVLADTAITAGRSLTISTDDIAADSELYTFFKAMTIEAPTDADNFFFFEAPVAMTITRVQAMVENATSAVITLQECDSAGDNAATIESVTADVDGVISTSIDNGAIDAGDIIRVDVGTVTGTVGQVSVTVTGTLDD